MLMERAFTNKVTEKCEVKSEVIRIMLMLLIITKKDKN